MVEKDVATFSLGDFSKPPIEEVKPNKLGDIEIEGIPPTIDEDPKEGDVNNGIPPVTLTTEEEDKTETPPVQTGGQTYLRDILKQFGIESFEIDGENEGEVVEVNVDEAELTLGQVQELVKMKSTSELEELKKGSVSLKELSEERKTVINFIAKGGDPRELIKIHEQQSNLREYNLDLEEDQIDILKEYYKVKGTDPEEAEMTLEGLKVKGKIAESAEKAATQLEKYFKDAEDAQIKALDEARKVQKDALDKYSKEFKGKAKNEFPDFDEKAIKTLSEFASKKIKTDTEGEFYEMDKVYQQKRSHPDFAPELALYLKDREKFIEYITKKKVTEVKLDAAKKIGVLRLTNGSNSKINDKTKFEKNNSNEIGLDEFQKRG